MNSVAIVRISNIISISLNQVLTVDRWQLLTCTHTPNSLCEPDMRISMFSCDVPQTLFVINSAAVSLKIINTRLTVFLNSLICYLTEPAKNGPVSVVPFSGAVTFRKTPTRVRKM
jgi:hypothetical protein